MLKCDLPDSPIASYRPEIGAGADSLEDRLNEAIHSYDGPMPRTLGEMAAIVMRCVKIVFTEADLHQLEQRVATREDEEVTTRFLQIMSRDTDRHYRMRALCLLRIMGREGRSFEELGKLLQVKRATVHKCYRDLQRRLGGLPGRGDKSAEAREGCRVRRTGQRRRREETGFVEGWKNRVTALLQAPVLLVSPSLS